MVAEIAKFALFAVINVAADLFRCVRGCQKSTILFESYDGAQVGGSPKAIYDYLHANHGSAYRYVWAICNDADASVSLPLDDSTTVCRYKSFRHLTASALASVLICDTARSGLLPRPRGQLDINTWHGTSYKNLGSGSHRLMAIEKRSYMYMMKRWDYFLSGSSLFSKVVIRGQLGYPGKILFWGTPRNDMLINSTSIDVKEIRQRIGIFDEHVLLVLYAPTWRDSGDAPILFDIKSIRSAIERRFGRRAVIAIRSHHAQAGSSAGIDLDLGGDYDVREVMLAADVLVSDYSSIIWDYSLLRRPLFLYCPDVEKYGRDRGFIVPPSEWGFPIACNSDELVGHIESFDTERHSRAIAFHHNLYGLYEDGRATKRIAEVIIDALRGGCDAGTAN